MPDLQDAVETDETETDEVDVELPPAVTEHLPAIREERETSPAPASVLPSAREWEATMAVARQIAATEFVPESYRGKPDSVVAAILTGREMGIGPMQAMRQIHMIDGRPAFAADLMLAKMRSGGLVIVDSSVDDDRAWIKAMRRDTGETAEVEWTYEEGTKVMRKGKPLTDGANWKNYRRDMLWARCVGRLARRLGSDLLGGLVYSAEEMQDWDADEGGYGGAGGYDATTFDPARSLLTGAPKDQAGVVAGLTATDASMDWGPVIAQAVGSCYSSDNWRELSQPEQNEVWTRLANVIVRLTEHGDPAFLTDPDVKAAFAEMFGGVDVDLPRAEAPLADQPVPEGDDEVVVEDAEYEVAEEPPAES